jgi:gas vesicle protein
MGQSADQIRRDIEATRRDLGTTIDEVTERTSPRRIAERSKRRMTDRMHSVRDKVMGTAEESAHQVQGQAQHLSDEASAKAHQAQQQARRQTQGNPLAAGLVAFGAGLLGASLVPASKPEREAAHKLAEQARPLTEQVKQEAKSAGQHIAEETKKDAQQAAQHVKEQAKKATDQVKQDATSSAEHVRDDAKGAAQDVRHKTQQ